VCVPGTILEGCCIPSGHPKIGKSFLVAASLSRGI
jgi:hypothetical protein